MTYKINGQIVTKEEWDAHTVKVRSKPNFKPIQSGSSFSLSGAQAFDSFVSPVDGSFIDSDHKLKEHNSRNGVRQVGDDLKGKGCEGRTREESINRQKGNKDE